MHAFGKDRQLLQRQRRAAWDSGLAINGSLG
jgi:hypothetical protein